MTAQSSPDLPASLQRTTRTGAGQDVGCPTCRTIEINPTCPDLWHHDNRTVVYRAAARAGLEAEDLSAAKTGWIEEAIGNIAADAGFQAVVDTAVRLTQQGMTVDRDAWGDRAMKAEADLETMTAVARSNKRHVATMAEYQEQLTADLAAMTARAESAEAERDEARQAEIGLAGHLQQATRMLAAAEARARLVDTTRLDDPHTRTMCANCGAEQEGAARPLYATQSAPEPVSLSEDE